MLVSYETRGWFDFPGALAVWYNRELIQRFCSFKGMSDKEWDQVMEVHLHGAFACAKAAWPIFRKQKFGRVINTASAAGIYGMWILVLTNGLILTLLIGNFGQANYSAAKMGLIGFSKTLAREGAKYNIRSTAIAPVRPISLAFLQVLKLTTWLLSDRSQLPR